MSGNAGFEKRLEQLGRVVGYRASRTIVLKLPTLLTPIEGSVEMASIVLPEVRAAADEMLEAIDVSDEDTVIEVARFTKPRTLRPYLNWSALRNLKRRIQMPKKWFEDGEDKSPKVRVRHGAAHNPVRTQRTGTQSHSREHDPLVKAGKGHKGK